MNNPEADPLSAVVNALKPMDAEGRRRTVEAALHYLGDAPLGQRERTSGPTASPQVGAPVQPPVVATWLQNNGVTQDELDLVIYVGKDNTFDIHDVPGKTDKERTLNVYILVGLATHLTGGEQFDDQFARDYCKKMGCFDVTNHSKYISSKGAELMGEKSKGWSLTRPGLKKAATLVKELAGSKK